MKKVLLVIALVLILGLGILSKNPIVICDDDLSEEYMEAIESQAEGLYSRKIPLVPVCVNITSFDDETVYYTIYYFPLGTVGMSYNKNDGYNMEKSLTRF
jgi:hypothetical protein